MTTEILVVWTTVPGAEAAAELGRQLVEDGLVACAQVDGGIRSFYRWEGEIQDDSETRLTLKTRRACWPQLRDRLGELHPYSVPQIVAVDAEAAAAYGQWVEESTRPGS